MRESLYPSPASAPGAAQLPGNTWHRGAPSKPIKPVHKPEGSAPGWLRPSAPQRSCSLGSLQTPGPGQRGHRALDAVPVPRQSSEGVPTQTPGKGLNHIRRASQTPNNAFCWLRSSYSSAQTTLTEPLAAPGLCRVLGSMMNRKTCVQHARHWPKCWDTMAKRPPTPPPSPLGSRGTWAKTLLRNTRSG